MGILACFSYFPKSAKECTSHPASGDSPFFRHACACVLLFELLFLDLLRLSCELLYGKPGVDLPHCGFLRSRVLAEKVPSEKQLA
jgi:hypothetical protein